MRLEKESTREQGKRSGERGGTYSPSARSGSRLTGILMGFQLSTLCTYLSLSHSFCLSITRLNRKMPIRCAKCPFRRDRMEISWSQSAPFSQQADCILESEPAMEMILDNKLHCAGVIDA